jgi:diguanylate cyclase (GGDEF)-like protein
MVDPTQLEKAILSIIAGLRIDDWVPFTIGELRNRLLDLKPALGVPSEGEIVECICSLEAESHTAARKFNGRSPVPFVKAQSADDYYRHQFFWIGSFELKITHDGRKAIAQKDVAATPVATIASTADEIDRRLLLFRREVFDSDLERFVTGFLDTGVAVALIMVDVDKFKQVNDTHGHPIGDEVLLAVSTTINKRVNGQGKAYRYGGEEFSILLQDYSKMEAAALAETIRLKLERSQVSEKKLKVTASFGVASVPEDTKTSKELLALADKALLSAKQRGRNLVRAVGDVDEVKEVGARHRKQPTPGVLTDDQQSAIRVLHFNGRIPRCPTDGTPLRVKELREVGFKTPSLHVNCPICGMQEYLPGA